VVNYRIPEPMPVRATLFDALGRQVARLADTRQPPGTHRLPIATSTLPSGLYFVRIAAGEAVETRRLTVIH
jgi:hypothetical protein